MDVVAYRSGRSWVVIDGGRELGIVTLSRSGKHGNEFFQAWSVVTDRTRWSLAAHRSLEDAAARVVAFDSEPARFMRIVHRVSAEAVEKRR